MIYGIGVDIANIGRIGLAIERSGVAFLNKVFTDREIAYCRMKRRPYAYFSVLFASKEAILKGFGKGWNFALWKNMEVILHDSEPPKINLYGRMAEEIQKNEIAKVHISVSYNGEYAVAFFIAECHG